MDNKDSILIWTDSLENSALLKHGMELAQKLDTNYYILSCAPTDKKFTLVLPNGEIIQSASKKAAGFIFDNKNQFGILFAITDIDFTGDILTKECVKKIKRLKKTELSFICLKENFSLSAYSKLLTITGYGSGEKEKVIWANYISKKLQSTLHIMVPTEKDEYIGKDIAGIRYYSQKLLTQSGNSFEIHDFKENTEKLKNNYTFSQLDENALYIVNIQYINFNPFKKDSDILYIERSGKTAIMVVPETDDSLIPCH